MNQVLEITNAHVRGRIGPLIATTVVVLALVFLVREMRSYFVDVP